MCRAKQPRGVYMIFSKLRAYTRQLVNLCHLTDIHVYNSTTVQKKNSQNDSLYNTLTMSNVRKVVCWSILTHKFVFFFSSLFFLLTYRGM